MADKTYRWCKMSRNGTTFTNGYIDSKAAYIGKHVQLVDLDNEFWEVLTVGEEVSKEFVNDAGNRTKTFSALEHTDRIQRVV